MPPVVLLAPTLHAARACAARQLPESPDDVLILAPSHAASRGWRRVLAQQDSSQQNSPPNGVWLPRIATPEEYFLEAATFQISDAPQWVTPAERRLLLRDILPQLRRRLKHLSRLARSSDLVRQLDLLIGDLRNSNLHEFDFGGDWSDDLRLIIGEYNRRLNERNAVDIECAPQLWAQSSVPVAAEYSCAVFDQILAPSPAHWNAMQTLTARAPGTLVLIVVPWLDKNLETWDEALPVAEGTAVERVLAMWRETGAQLQVVRAEYSDAKQGERAAPIRALLDHRRAAAPRHLTVTPCHTPRDETERIAAHLRARVSSVSELENCVLALPDATIYAPNLNAAFASHGVPLRALRARPAHSHPLVARIVKLFGLSGSEWTLDEISDLFGDGVLRACHECEVLDARRLRAPCLESRFDSLLDLEHCRARVEAARAVPNARLKVLETDKIARDLQCLSTLKARCERLDGDLTARQWSHAAQELLHETTSHLREEDSCDVLVAQLDDEVLVSARAQIRCVEAALARVGNFAARWLGNGENETRRGADFLDWLRLELETSEIENADSLNGFAVEFHGAALEVCEPLRLLCDVPPVVYFAGLVENAWPRSEAGSTLLARHRTELGVLRAHRGEAAAWAHYQLALCIREAEEVHLSHPQWQAGREVLRSPLLEDLAACWGELPPLQSARLPTSRAQLLRSLGAKAREGLPLSNTRIEPDESGASTLRLMALLELHCQRADEKTIGVYDGALGAEGAQILQKLRALSKQSEWSMDATRLKTYAQCPLKWFFRYVLKLEAPAELRDDLRGDESGSLLHKILERFGIEYLPYNALEAGTGAEAWFKLQNIAREEIEKRVARPILREIEARRLLGHQSSNRSTQEFGGVLGKWLESEIAQASGEMAKAAFSSPLLPASGGALPLAMARGVEVDFKLPLGNKEIRGHMDRLALSSGGEVLAVFDYKTENPDYLPRFSHADSGLDFQLPVYLLAARELWRQASENSNMPIPMPKLCAAFFTMRGAKWLGGIGEAGTLGRNQTKKGAGAICHQHGVELPPEIFHAWLDAMEERLVQIANLWQRAQFPLSINDAAQAGCAFCDYQNICRRDDGVAAAREQSHFNQYSLAVTQGRGEYFQNVFYLPISLLAQRKSNNTAS
jgi:hypothetical protein